VLEGGKKRSGENRLFSTVIVFQSMYTDKAKKKEKRKKRKHMKPSPGEGKEKKKPNGTA